MNWHNGFKRLFIVGLVMGIAYMMLVLKETEYAEYTVTRVIYDDGKVTHFPNGTYHTICCMDSMPYTILKQVKTSNIDVDVFVRKEIITGVKTSNITLPSDFERQVIELQHRSDVAYWKQMGYIPILAGIIGLLIAGSYYLLWWILKGFLKKEPQ